MPKERGQTPPPGIEEAREALEAELESLRQDRALLLGVLESAPALVMRVDVDGTIRFMSRVVRGFELEKVIGTNLADYLDPESAEVQRAALADTGLGLWCLDPETWEVELDDTVRGILGVGPGEGPRTLDECVAFVHPEDRTEALAALFRSLGAEGGTGVEMRLLRPDGESRWVLARSRPRRGGKGSAPKLLGGLLDVTERHRMEETLRVAQRLQAVGQLAAGVAHDFNNLLMIVGPTLELAARRSPPFVAETLADVREAVR